MFYNLQQNEMLIVLVVTTYWFDCENILHYMSAWFHPMTPHFKDKILIDIDYKVHTPFELGVSWCWTRVSS
jgi:hypothetical protein